MAAELITYEKRNELPNDKAILVFHHLAKCGGSTLRAMLRRHYGGHTRDLDAFSSWAIGKEQGAHPSPEPTCFMGVLTYGIHRLLPAEEKVFYITFLRDPLKRAISHYKYLTFVWAMHNVDPNFFLYNIRKNPFIQDLGDGDKGLAEERLFQEFAFFGITERYDESIAGLCGLLPQTATEEIQIEAKNVSRKDPVELNKSTIDYFLEMNAEDIELYQKAVAEFGKRFPAAASENKRKKDSGALHLPDRERNQLLKGKSLLEEYIRIVMDDDDARRDEIIPAQLSTIYHGGCDKTVLYNYLMKQTKHRLDCRYFAFLCSLAFCDIAAIQGLANEICDGIDVIDEGNNIPYLVLRRLEIISSLLDHCLKNRLAVSLPKRRVKWIRSFRKAREKTYCAESWAIEAKMTAIAGDLPSAVRCAEKASGLFLGNTEYALLLYDFLMMSNEFDRAIDICGRLTAIMPDNMTYRENLISLLIRQESLAQAEKMALDGIAAHPDLAWPCFQLSRVHEVRGDLALRKEYALKAWEMQPEKRMLAENMARALRQLHEYDECAAFCQKRLEKDSQQGWAWRELFRCAEESGMHEKALEYGSRAIAVHPGDAAFQDYYAGFIRRC